MPASWLASDRTPAETHGTTWTGGRNFVCNPDYERPRTADADFAILAANCRASGSALSGVCLRVASQRPWAKQVLTAYGTMCNETTSRVREAGKRLAPSRSHKSLTEPISFR